MGTNVPKRGGFILEINGWGIALIALYIVCKHGFKFWLAAKIGGAIKKAKGMMRNDNGNSVDV